VIKSIDFKELISFDLSFNDISREQIKQFSHFKFIKLNSY
jgi:hypothetical protein